MGSASDEKKGFLWLQSKEVLLYNILYGLHLFIDIVRFLLTAFMFIGKSAVEFIIPKREKNIAGQLALITGAGNGLGRSLALKFADRGCNVIIADIDLEAAEKTVGEIRKKGVVAQAYQADISDQQQINLLHKQIVNEFGQIDILVNNAAIVYGLPFQECETEAIEKMVKVNLTANLLMIKTFIAGMIENERGHIVTISSMSGMYAFPQNLTYSATKHAVNGFMLSLNEYLRAKKLDKQIKTSCVMPIFINTIPVVSNEYRQPNSRTVLMTADFAAEETIKGILEEEVLFSIPRHLKLVTAFMNLLPIKLQQDFRDIIVKDT